MKTPTRTHPLAVRLAVLLAAAAAFVTTSQAQVTLSQVTNGLVGWYPLDYVLTNGTTLTTPDYLNGRDMILSPAANGTNVIASTRPSLNSATVSNCFNLSQSGGATVLYYNSKGQDAVTGGGDFLPFCNQINATMSFWIKANATSGFQDSRFFGECDTTGRSTIPPGQPWRRFRPAVKPRPTLTIPSEQAALPFTGSSGLSWCRHYGWA